jgi:hypothetical protein
MLRAKARPFIDAESEWGRFFPVGGAIAISGEVCLTTMGQSWTSIFEDLIDQSKMSVPDIRLEKLFDKIEFKPSFSERSIDNAGLRSSPQQSHT